MKTTSGHLFSRRHLLQSAAATALVSSTGLAAHAQGAAKLTPVKVSTSIPTVTQGATFLIKPLKTDAKHGLDVELLQMGGSSTLMIDAVVSGNASFGLPGVITVLQAIRAGADLMVLGAFSNNQIAAVISKTAMAKTGLTEKSPIADKIKAMKGLIIGTNPQGATYTQMFEGYLKKQGIDPTKDVRMVYITDTMALVSGIDQGRYDAIVSASSIVEQAVSLGSANMWFAGGTGEIPGSETEMVAVVIARRETVEKSPDLVKAFLATMQDGLDALNTNREAMNAILYKEYFNKMDPAVWKMVMDSTTKGFPTSMKFTKAMYDGWTAIDPKGPDSYKDIDYKKITYGPNQG
jgi:NitT/TauT family transport system substrate-binding protein